MNSARMIILGGVLGIVSQAALAFQETNGGAQAPALPGTTATSKIDLGQTPSRSGGSEIHVPGLGSIGALPKLDFGLELLYGATSPQSGPRDDKSDAGAQIRGTLKYRFPN
jgi:hypothetical protein